jgi:hypothetical protein
MTIHDRTFHRFIAAACAIAFVSAATIDAFAQTGDSGKLFFRVQIQNRCMPTGAIERGKTVTEYTEVTLPGAAGAGFSLIWVEYSQRQGLGGGEIRIRTPEILSHSMEGILPFFGHYAASKKGSRAEEPSTGTA